MGIRNMLVLSATAIAVATGAVAPACATTLVRAGLDALTAANSTIIVGEVLDAHSYWNEEGTFILTDVSVAAAEVLKGDLRDRKLTVTLMGGTVGDLTTLIIGGAELVPGRPYVLFLSEENLPGAKGVRTVRDHCQGVFEIVLAKDGLRAVSQASPHPLVPDKNGRFEAPGGVEGLPFDTLVWTIRELTERPIGARQEVK